MSQGSAADLAQTHWTQPALYAVASGLAALWRSWGLEPQGVAGHSLGEYAAAQVAGVFELESGLRLVAQRGRLMAALPAPGGMAAVSASLATVTAVLAGLGDAGQGAAQIGAVNGPTAVTLTGGRAALAAAQQALTAAGHRVQPLPVSQAFHSDLLTPMVEDFAGELARIDFQPPQLAWARGLDGAWQSGAPDVDFWLRSLRQPVRFDLVQKALAELGETAWLELGAKPQLLGLAAEQQVWAANPSDAGEASDASDAGEASPTPAPLAIASLRLPRGAQRYSATSLRQALTRAALQVTCQLKASAPNSRPDWRKILAKPDNNSPKNLPTYPYQKTTFWPLKGRAVKQMALSVQGTETVRAAERNYEVFHQVVWQPLAAARPAFKTGADSLGAAAWPDRLRQGVSGDPAWPAFLDRLDGLCAALAGAALRRAWAAGRGKTWRPGLCFSTQDWLDRTALQPDQVLLFQRLCAMAVEGGDLTAQAEGWQVIVSPSTPQNLDRELSALIDTQPAFRPELTLLAQAVDALPDVLCGRTQGVELLFDNPEVSLQALYGDAPLAGCFNRLAGDLLAADLAGGPVSVLEIGAGSGATTAALLPQLPPGSRYHFTDISQAFLDQAARRFAATSGIDFTTGLLDISQPAPAEQAGRRDLVVAANVLHATADLKAALEQAVRRLKPGGRLLLLEVTRRRRRFDLVFGLTPGWWAFSDRDLRPDHALLAPADWRALLTDLGLEVLAILPEDLAGDLPDQSVILAAKPVVKAPEKAVDKAVDKDLLPGRWLVTGPGAPALQAATPGSDLLLASDLEALRARLADPDLQARGLLYLATAGQASSPEDGEVRQPEQDAETADDGLALLTPVLQAAQALMASDKSLPLWIVTQGGAPDALSGHQTSAAALWGLGRTFAREAPGNRGGVIDLAPASAWAGQLAAFAAPAALVGAPGGRGAVGPVQRGSLVDHRRLGGTGAGHCPASGAAGFERYPAGQPTRRLDGGATRGD